MLSESKMADVLIWIDGASFDFSSATLQVLSCVSLHERWQIDPDSPVVGLMTAMWRRAITKSCRFHFLSLTHTVKRSSMWFRFWEGRNASQCDEIQLWVFSDCRRSFPWCWFGWCGRRLASGRWWFSQLKTQALVWFAKKFAEQIFATGFLKRERETESPKWLCH